MDIHKLIEESINRHASDLHISVGLPPILRINGHLTEIMMSTSAISNLIRENKTHQINNVIQTSGIKSMKSMDACLLELLKQDKISVEDAIGYSVDPTYIIKQLSS